MKHKVRMLARVVIIVASTTSTLFYDSNKAGLPSVRTSVCSQKVFFWLFDSNEIWRVYKGR